MKKHHLIIAASSFVLNFIFNNVAIAAKDDAQKDTTLYSKSDKALAKAEDDVVYDPVKKRWTRVKNLTGVEVKDKKSEGDDDKLLYDDSWAFNEKEEKWGQVDVNSNLYEEADDEDDDDTPKTFWQNLSINLSLGVGLGFYSNSLKGLSILKKGSETYLQSAAQKKNKEATLTKWFYGDYATEKFDNATATPVREDKKEKVFTGTAIEVPMTISIDYTLYDTIRLGMDFSVEAYIIDKMELSSTGKKPKHKISGMMNGKTFLWSMRPMANVGYVFLNNGSSSWLLNMQVGPTLDKGTEMLGAIRRGGLFMSLGLGWEPRLNDYLTLSTRLSYGFKKYVDDVNPKNAPLFGNKDSSITMWQQSVKGEVGLRIACAKISEEDEE